MADQLLFAPVRVLTTNAAPGAGYVASFYQSGTTTPVTVYTDSGTATPHGVSVTADATGTFPAVWAAGGAAIKAVIRDADGATVDTIDPVPAVSDTSGAAGSISFAPTVELPFTNVQDAIEGAAESAAAGFAAYGIGITGNAEILADLDATNIGAGVYRFGAATTGTYPTGVAAVDTGLVETWRQSSSAAMMYLFHATTDRVFHRRLASGSWGTWREVLTVNQGAAEGDTLYRGASAWTRLAKGTAGQVLRINSGVTAPEWAATSTAVGPEDMAGDSTVDITGIPAGVTRVEIPIISMDPTGSGHIFVRLGTAGGMVTSGYEEVSSSDRNNGATTATGLLVYTNGRKVSGIFTLILADAATNTWVSGHSVGQASDAAMHGGGKIALSGPLTQLRVAVSSGETFTSGSFAVRYYF